MAIVRLITIATIGVAASFVAVLFTTRHFAVFGTLDEVSFFVPFLIIVPFWFGCRLFGRIKTSRMMIIATAMFASWAVADSLFVPDLNVVPFWDESTAIEHHRFEFRAHVAAIAVGLVLLLLLQPFEFSIAKADKECRLGKRGCELNDEIRDH